MKQNLKNINIIVAALVIIIIPILIYCFLAKQATLGEWLGFFGTYFGSAISIGFSYINTKYQLKKRYEKEIVDNLHKLSREIEAFLNPVYDLQEILYQMLNEEKLIQSKNGVRDLVKEITNVIAQTDNFTVEFDYVMNQLEKRETKVISPIFKAWFDSYHSFYILKSISNNYSTKKELSGYSIRDLLKIIEIFIDKSRDLKSIILKVYDKRMKETIG